MLKVLDVIERGLVLAGLMKKRHYVKLPQARGFLVFVTNMWL